MSANLYYAWVKSKKESKEKVVSMKKISLMRELVGYVLDGTPIAHICKMHNCNYAFVKECMEELNLTGQWWTERKGNYWRVYEGHYKTAMGKDITLRAARA